MQHQQLLDRIEELEQLLGCDDHFVQHIRHVLRVSLSTAKTIGFLLAREHGTREGIYVMLYGTRPDADQPSIREIDQWVWRARRALKGHGINIVSCWGTGYMMALADKAALKTLLGTGTECQVTL